MAKNILTRKGRLSLCLVCISKYSVFMVVCIYCMRKNGTFSMSHLSILEFVIIIIKFDRIPIKLFI